MTLNYACKPSGLYIMSKSDFDPLAYRILEEKQPCVLEKAMPLDLDDLAEKLEADPEMSEEELIAWAKAKEMPLEDDKIFGGAEYRRYLLGVVVARMLRDYGKGGQS